MKREHFIYLTTILIILLLVTYFGLIRTQSTVDVNGISPVSTSTLVMSESEARIIAGSSCIKGGTVLDTGMYDTNTKMWVYDANTNARQEGCRTYCTVDAVTRVAKMELRCTDTVATGSPRIAAGNVVGHVTIGPFCPVQREGEVCPVPEEAYTSRSVIVYEANATTVKERVKLDAKGNYKLALGPGTYFLQIEPAGIGPGEKKKVVVISFKTTIVDFDIDTGIR